MSKTTLEKRLMNIPLSKTAPKHNYSCLFEEVIQDEVFNKTIDHYLEEHPVPAQKPALIKKNLKKNIAKLIVAHILYNKFEKYRDKHFGPALFQYSAGRTKSQKYSRLNKETNNKFCSVYAYFNTYTPLNMEDIISRINHDCQINIVYVKNHEGGIHKLKDYGITKPEFLQIYQEYRAEVMRDTRIHFAHEEARKLLGAPEFKNIKNQFSEALINIIIHCNIIHTIPKYKNNELHNAQSRINKDSNNLFLKSECFFQNHSDIFGDFKYACDFLEDCGFKIIPNNSDMWNKIETAGAIDDVEAKQVCKGNYASKAYLANRMQITQSCLNTLPPRTQEIIRLRYGLDGTQEHTLCQVADIVGLTRAGIYRIEFDAIAKLERLVTVAEK